MTPLHTTVRTISEPHGTSSSVVICRVSQCGVTELEGSGSLSVERKCDNQSHLLQLLHVRVVDAVVLRQYDLGQSSGGLMGLGQRGDDVGQPADLRWAVHAVEVWKVVCQLR